MPFETTRWSLVVAAGGDDSSAARAALATLCETYWYPLYAYVRRRGASADDARDLTQGFLTSLLERRDFEHLRQERGRFRAFLLASLQHFLANDAARRRTQKRGGGMTLLPLAFDDAEGRYRFEPRTGDAGNALRTPLGADGHRARARASCARVGGRGREAEFDALKACLLGQAPAGRLRGHRGQARHHRRRGEGRRPPPAPQVPGRAAQDIAETVSDPADVDDEIRYLVRALERVTSPRGSV